MELKRVAMSEILAVIPSEPKPTPVKRISPLANFPVRYRGLSLDMCEQNEGNALAIDEARRWATAAVDNLFFYGPQGTGKTFIAAAAMAERAGVPEFINIPSMLLKFQAGVKEHDELELIGEYTGYAGRNIPQNYRQPLRLFDDLAAHRISDFAIEMFGIMLDKLYSNCCGGMIFTSNLSPKQILDAMGERIASRLQGLAKPIRVDGSDWRLK